MGVTTTLHSERRTSQLGLMSSRDGPPHAGSHQALLPLPPSHPPKRCAFDHEIRRPRHSRRSFRRAAARPAPKSLPTSPRSRLDLCHSPGPSIRRWGRRASLTAGPCSADESGTTRAIADCESPVSSMGFVPLRDFDRAPLRPTVSSLTESRFPAREPTPKWRHPTRRRLSEARPARLATCGLRGVFNVKERVVVSNHRDFAPEGGLPPSFRLLTGHPDVGLDYCRGRANIGITVQPT